VGLLREDFFCYAEDLEWGLRARAAGFSILYVPGSRVWHKVSRSTGGERSVTPVRYLTRNLLACVDEHAPLPPGARQLRHGAILVAGALGVLTHHLPLAPGLAAVAKGAADWRRKRMGRLPSP
jgi:GT2 family glycosyltransferase